MKVWAIYLNDTEGTILVHAKSEKRALELFRTNAGSPVVIQEIDLEGIKIDIYPTQLYTNNDTEGIELYCISQDLGIYIT